VQAEHIEWHVADTHLLGWHVPFSIPLRSYIAAVREKLKKRHGAKKATI
jgi:hypothetical protein